jgi:calcineurin-like phosphoesterase family protein
MTKFLVVGDTHGDVPFVSNVCKLAKSLGVDTVYQVGDFGIWDHRPDGVYFLDKLSENAGLRGCKWKFVAGNHENYDSLERHALAGTMDDGMVYIRENITWVGRSNVWYHDDVLMGAVGGAASIDRHARTPGVSWWPQELTTMGDVHRFGFEMQGRKVGALDVLLTHDAPMCLPEWNGFIKDDPMSNGNRELMTEVGHIANATWWFHGHYHKELSYKFNNTQVYGLDCNIEWRFQGQNVALWDDGNISFYQIGQ